MKAESIAVPPRLRHEATRRRSWLRFSLRWLIAAMAFLAVVTSHVKTSLYLRQSEQKILQQQAELTQLRDELGVFEVTDPAKVHVIFVRQMLDRAWRWRVYLPTGRRYNVVWNEGRSAITVPQEQGSTFTIDVFLRKRADDNWAWFLRYPGGESIESGPDDRYWASDNIVLGESGVTVLDPSAPFVLFTGEVISPLNIEEDLTPAQREVHDRLRREIKLSIEPAK